MSVNISKQNSSTKIKMGGTKEIEYLISEPVNLITKDDTLKVIFNHEKLKNDNNMITINYNDIENKLGSSTLTEYMSTALALGYFTN